MSVVELAARRQRRLAIAIGLNLVVVAGQVVAGLIGHSLGLIADAGHNIADVAALVIALVAVRLSLRAPTKARSFGHHRATILAALANGGLLLAVTAFLVVEGALRLFSPPQVRGGLVLAVALAAAALNGVGALLVHERGGRRDLNMSGAVLHLAADAAVSLSVAAAGLVIMVANGARWLDPAVSVAIGVVICAQAIRLLRRSADVLLESTPRGIDPAAVTAAIGETPGVIDVHDLHVWSLSSDVYALSAHVALAGHPTLEQAQAAVEVVKRELAQRFSIGHATIEAECEACPEPDPCTLEAAAPAHPHPHAAARATPPKR